jgi:hypothetical protein
MPKPQKKCHILLITTAFYSKIQACHQAAHQLLVQLSSAKIVPTSVDDDGMTVADTLLHELSANERFDEPINDEKQTSEYLMKLLSIIMNGGG